VKVAKSVIRVVLLAVWAVVVAAPAMAQDNKAVPMVVGVMDTQVILKQSKAGKSLDKLLKDKQSAIQGSIREKEKALQSERQQLEQQRAALSQNDFQAKENQLRGKMQALRDESEKQRKDFLAARDRGFQQIISQVDKVVQEIARERGLTLILNKSMIIMSAEAWDITPEVVKRLDAALPSVKL
jgi:outer membrane protein